MENSKITLESLAPLAEAEREHLEKWAAFRAARDELQAVVGAIAERQRGDAAKIGGMLAELEAEEQKLRESTRQQALTRARCALNGRRVPSNDFSAGARLAAIPEEKAALEALRDHREANGQEQEEYEAALEAAQAAAMEGRSAAASRDYALKSVSALVSAAQGAFEGIPHPFDLSDITGRFDYLSTTPADEDEGGGYVTQYGTLGGGHKA